MTFPLQTPAPQKNRRRFAVWVVVAVVVVLAWYGVLAVGVYGFGWQGQKTQAIVRITPLPAALVGWRPISLAQYLQQREAMVHYTNYLAKTTTGVYQPTPDQDARALTLTTMIKLNMLERLARTAGVSVTPADVEQAYQAQLLQNGNANEVAATIRQLYDWTPEEFRSNVIRPAILRDKMQSYLSFDEQRSAQAKAQATAVVALVTQAQEDFSAIAKKYSEDVYGANGGDLGFVNKGELTQEIDDAAFGQELNTVSGIIHTKYGFHIIKPVERRTVDGVDQVHLYQITVLAPSVDDFTTAALRTTRVRVFVPHLTWDAQNNRASVRP